MKNIVDSSTNYYQIALGFLFPTKFPIKITFLFVQYWLLVQFNINGYKFENNPFSKYFELPVS